MANKVKVVIEVDPDVETKIAPFGTKVTKTVQPTGTLAITGSGTSTNTNPADSDADVDVD